jgi:glutamine amidotransferase-like uncharacterized protein
MRLPCLPFWFFLSFLLALATTKAQQPPLIDVAVYMDRGVWEAGATAFEHFLDWKGLTHERVDARVLNSTELQRRYRVLCIPGGYAYDYKLSILEAGERRIREFVDAGGAYIGICAGAFYASTKVHWEGANYSYSLALSRGQAFGPLEAISPWPEYALTTISLNQHTPVTTVQQQSFTTLYFGGPSFIPDPDMVIDTIATWDEHHDRPAIIAFERGKGRVLLIGPHLEIEENSSRDGGNFGDELHDPETEWGLVWAMMDWVMGNAVTDTLRTTVVHDGYLSAEKHRPNLHVFPNPARDVVTIFRPQSITAVIEIRDLLGRCFHRSNVDISNGARLNISELRNGTFMLFFHTANGTSTTLLHVVR